MNVTLICLPFAGGAAAVYRGWAALLPAWIRLQTIELPGHGSRRAEPALQHWPELTDALVREAMHAVDGPFAIFGHSMGALAGLELAHALRERRGVAPVWLGASACVAPARRELAEAWLDCPRDDMITELRRLGGTPAELLGDDEFVDFVLPTLRADFHLCGTYAARADQSRPALDCPFLVLAGRDDPISADARNLTAWSEESNGTCTQRMFDGGHFFIERSRQQVVETIVASLHHVLEVDAWTF